MVLLLTLVAGWLDLELIFERRKLDYFPPRAWGFENLKSYLGLGIWWINNTNLVSLKVGESKQKK